MMNIDLLLNVRTALHRYIVRRGQFDELRLITNEADLEKPDERGRSIVSYNLGGLLDPQDIISPKRCHALIVHMRRRSVALLVERVEDAYSLVGMAEHETIQPLPPLLAQGIENTWLVGVVVRDDIPLLVLDLRQVARDMLLREKQKPQPVS
jgi:chemotaxis signal transduction protein